MHVDPQFEYELNKQPRDNWAQVQLFTPDEVRQLAEARCRIERDQRTVAYAVYENHFARGGGIFAVAQQLPPRLAKRNRQVVILSPFHSRLNSAPRQSDRTTPRPPGEQIGTISVPFAGGEVSVALYRYVSDGIPWVLLGAEGYFAAEGDSPYNLPDEVLLRDGMLAAVAIPHVLKHLGYTRNIVVHVQDWQLASLGLTVKHALLDGDLESAAVVLTSHNPYDCPLEEDQLRAITHSTAAEQWARAADGRGDLQRRGTIYECMMPLMDAPISTVSRQYAHDLTHDPLQTGHFADHLQAVLRRQGLVGVNNGLFMAPVSPFTLPAVQGALYGDGSAILREKSVRRRNMLRALSCYRPPQSLGFLRHGDDWDLTQLPDSVPVFMMFGRMDPGQKGFDLLAAAIRRIQPGAARFVICPIIPGGVEPYLEQWRDLVYSRPGDVIVYTGRMERYLETMAGASFCVMPSLHEPFGAATEPYLKGTPVVAHATGGLIQQVLDRTACPQQATGILFHSVLADDPVERGRQWRALMTADGPAERMRCPLYVSLVNGLVRALEQAIDVYRRQPRDYARLLARLYDQALKFSWEQAAAEYTAIYDKASRDD